MMLQIPSVPRLGREGYIISRAGVYVAVENWSGCGMTLFDFLKKDKAAIYENWLALIFQTYHKDTAVFLEKQNDQFAHPVGHALSEGILEILDILVEQRELGDMTEHLDRIVKIRSIQGQNPSQALSFVYFPKKVVRKLFEAEIKKSALYEDLEKFDERVDEMALLAFDIYVSCREKLSDIRVNEVRRQVAQILKRTGFVEMDSSLEPANQEGGCLRRPVKGGD
jgi:hypothetical protein